MKPIIGILAHPSGPKDKINPFNYIGENYTNSIEKAGGIPIILPVIDKEEVVNDYIDLIDGLLIPGGIDVVNDSHHLDEIHEQNKIFDEFEFKCIKQAKEKRIPILGICRGIQILNVYHGGTLIQDIPSEVENCLNHKQEDPTRWAISHSVSFEKDSHLYELFGESLDVNSFHHQSCKDVADNFKVVGTSSDGIIEAIEDTTDYPYLIGVQWHPEGFVSHDDTNMPLFIDFIKVCKKTK